jgi:hypothetical protein
MNDKPETTDYLGDGLYVVLKDNQVELRANDFDRPTDTVYLDERTLKAFRNWLERWEL